MPYCVHCGNGVGDTDKFCAKCGAPQKAPSGSSAGSQTFASRPSPDPFGGISNRNAALLCYIPMVGWIAAIVVLASERFRREAQTRFHAFQGLYLFVTWLMVDWVIRPALYFSDFGFSFPHLATRLLQVVIFGAWIVMIIKVSQGEDYRLPILGELAERSVSEQRS